MKLITVPMNGQISIGKSWAGRQIQLVVQENEIHISAGTFVPDSQKAFFSKEAQEALDEFNEFERTHPASVTDTDAFFAELKKKKQSSGKK